MYPDHDIVRVFVKGAPEQMIFNCNSTFDENGDVITLEDEQRNQIIEHTIGEEFAKNGFRCLGFSFRDFTIEEFSNLKVQNNNFATDSDREALTRGGLRLISIFALEDTLRKEARSTVKLAIHGKIDVRLISGDHLQTAVYFAKKAKIISKAEAEDKTKISVLTGEQFRAKVGGVRKDKEGNYYLEDPTAFKDVVIRQRLRVIGRARPEDKIILSVGLKEFGKTVAATGEGINDIRALQIADVGFSMGSGVSAAKNSAQMILSEDNVMSILNAVLWGRNVYSNVRKFI